MNILARTEKTLRDAIEAERGTIDALGDSAAIVKAAERYAQLDLDTPLVHTVKRNSGRKAVAANLSPILINLYVKRRDLKSLTQVLRTFNMAKVEASFRPAAHLALARAYVLMRQFPPAAQQWINLLHGRSDVEVPWEELAEFVATCGDICGLHGAVNERVERDEHMSSAAMLTKLLLDIGSGNEFGDEILQRIDIDSIERPELLFDLALSALRLGQFECAAVSARQGLTLRGDWQALENLLSTIEAFRGESVQHLESIILPAEATDAVLSAANDVSQEAFAWGTLVRGNKGTFRAEFQPFSDSEDRELDLSGQDNTAVATFSVLPRLGRPSHDNGKDAWQISDPMMVLPYLDWELPHLMCQRRGKSSYLHAFVRSNQMFRDWWFCPRSLQDETSPDCDELEDADGISKRLLWRQVRLELEKVYLKEANHESD